MVLQRNWGDITASRSLSNIARCDAWQTGFTNQDHSGTGLHRCLGMCSWTYELRLEEIIDIQQEIGKGRCFRPREQGEETSQPLSPTETYIFNGVSIYQVLLCVYLLPLQLFPPLSYDKDLK